MYVYIYIYIYIYIYDGVNKKRKYMLKEALWIIGLH